MKTIFTLEHIEMQGLLVAVVVSCSLLAQSYSDDPRLASMPDAITAVLNSHKELEVYNVSVPLFYSADFDGDGRVDYVVRVQDSAGEMGLLFVMSSLKRERILGFGDGGDIPVEWTFTDWRLYRKWQEIWGESEADASSRKWDYLELIWEGRGGGMIEFRNGTFRWIGQGD
jgi:hypothetical protein